MDPLCCAAPMQRTHPQISSYGNRVHEHPKVPRLLMSAWWVRGETPFCLLLHFFCACSQPGASFSHYCRLPEPPDPPIPLTLRYMPPRSSCTWPRKKPKLMHFLPVSDAGECGGPLGHAEPVGTAPRHHFVALSPTHAERHYPGNAKGTRFPCHVGFPGNSSSLVVLRLRKCPLT